MRPAHLPLDLDLSNMEFRLPEVFMLTQHLHAGWTVMWVTGPESTPLEARFTALAAELPGSIHTDLQRAGLLTDPLAPGLEWVTRSTWRYATTFSVPGEVFAQSCAELRFEGLDTVAAIELNGTPLGSCANAHHPFTFDVRSVLRSAGNELTVTFSPTLTAAEAARAEHGGLPFTGTHPYNMLRTPAYALGWDFAPELGSCGFTGPVELRGWSAARLEGVRPLVVRCAADAAVLEIHAGLRHAGNEGVRLQATLTEPSGRTFECAVFAGDDTAHAVLTLNIPHPQLWWPRGYGAQPLYGLVLKLTAAGGRELDRWHGRIGLRSVKLNTAPDPAGASFGLEINGQPVFCRGANWVPDDMLPQRVTPERIRLRVQHAAEANLNCLRVWGGGLYAPESFYTACDELGLLVWQDFAFACAAYPEDEAARASVAAEARHQLTRLSAHPSLVLWCGGNECIWGHADWGWKAQLGAKPWGMGYYLDLLPGLCRELDPTRPYWPNTPFSGAQDLPPNDERYGTQHLWEPWNKTDAEGYRKSTPRFAAEFGFAAPAAYSTLAAALGPQLRALKPDAPALQKLNRAQNGVEKLNARIAEQFPAPQNFDDWHFAAQLVQARSVALGVDWFRSRQPICSGALVWQLNDVAPGVSWSAIDSAGRRKPLWFALRRAFADRAVTIQPEADGKLYAYVINDSPETWRGQLYTGRVNFAWSHGPGSWVNVFVPPRSVQQIPLDAYDLPQGTTPSLFDSTAAQLNPGLDRGAELLFVQIGALRALWFFERDKHLKYPAPQFDADVTAERGAYTVKLTARALLRDICLFADRLDPDARVNDQLITLVPGESYTFTVTSEKALPIDALTRAPVLRCANDLRAR